MLTDMGQLSAAIGSLKTAGEIAQAILGIRDTLKLQGKVIELNTVILSAQHSALAAQEGQFALLKRIRELEEEVAQVKRWDAEAEKYECAPMAPGVVAVHLKSEANAPEPSHLFCANCFKQQKFSYLKRTPQTKSLPTGGRAYVHVCNTCKDELVFGSAPMLRGPTTARGMDNPLDGPQSWMGR
jgi:hypothetical protein